MPPSTGYMLIKHDAFQDRHVPDIEKLLSDVHHLDIADSRVIELTMPEILAIYRPDTPEVMSEKDQALRALGLSAMVGTNEIVELVLPGTECWEQIVARLKAARGKCTDDPSARTVRGVFPSPRCEGYDQLSFWEQAVYFVRNRIHTPDTMEAALVLRDMIH